MNTIPHASGIYQIVCVPTGKVYVGSAIDLHRRFKDHWKALKGDRHVNPHLQNAWNKYGPDSFQFEVIELVLASFLLEREQYWIDRTNSSYSHLGFNICVTAGSNLGRTFSEDVRRAASEAKSQEWAGFIDPNGVAVTIKNLWRFCRDNSLSFGAMWNLATGKGRIKSYKGWTHQDNPRKERVFRPYEGFVDPDGNEVPPITNLGAFCREHNLSAGHMRDIYHGVGKLKSHRGWTRKR